MANRFRWLSLAVACVPAVLAAAACGGDTEEPGGTGGSGGSTGGSAGAAGSAAGDASVGRGGSSTGGSGGSGGTNTRPPDCGDAGIVCPPEGNQNRERVHCDAPRNRCVECLAESDCATRTGQNGQPGETHCNVMQGSCEQCVFGNAQLGCPTGFICQEDGDCEPSCASDADCATNTRNPACNPATMTCTECLTDTHCATNTNQPVCDVAEQECVECNTNAHCAARPNGATEPICNPMEHECGQCLVDADCATRTGTPFCRPQNNTCIACRTVADCPTGATGCSGGNNPGRCQFPSDGGTSTDAAPATSDARAEATTPREAGTPAAVDAGGQ